MTETSDLIPCEICDQLISSEAYHTHLANCITNRLFHIEFVIDRRDRRLQSEDGGGSGDEESNHEEEDDDLSSFVSMNPQLVTGRNLRHFLDSHTDAQPLTRMGVVFFPMASNLMRMQEVDLDDYELNLELARRVGTVSVGVKDIDSISKLIPQPDDEPKDDICPICRETIGGEEKVARELICGHLFCDACICKWLRSSKKCPLCVCDLDDMLSEIEKKTKKIETI